ncbi:hypothetical protein L579_0683 [Pantoea sp. AS-PWVM4]|nr:hypothetical protein L579_0683 [Pantoea sp. AS-PWVM4]
MNPSFSECGAQNIALTLLMFGWSHIVSLHYAKSDLYHELTL